MSNFFTLVSIENIKLWKRLSTKIMLVIMIGIIIAATGIMKYYNVSNHVSNTIKVSENWKQDVKQDLVVQENMLKTAKKSTDKVSKLLIGTARKGIAEDEYKINNNVKPESHKNVWTRVTNFDSAAPYSSIIALLLIVSCSALVAGEFSEGTMKMMISRPYKRYEILTAKLAATLIYGIVLVIITFLLNFIMIGLFDGFNGMGAKEMLWTSNKIIYIPAILKTIIIFGLDFLKVIIYIMLAFAISTLSRSRSIATGFSLFLLLAGSTIMQQLAIYFSWGKYLPFATYDFSSIVTTGACIEGTTLAFAIIISAIYSIIFCVVGYWAFEKKDI